MHVSRQTCLVVSITVLVLLAGCLSGVGVEEQQSPTATTTQGSSGGQSECVEAVSFWGLKESGAWKPDQVAISYTIPSNASVFFVVYDNDTVVGTMHRTIPAGSSGLHADGDSISLAEPLEGNHTIRITAYSDTNGNGEFDPTTDSPCRKNGRIVQEDPRTINFSSLQSTPRPSTATTTTETASE